MFGFIRHAFFIFNKRTQQHKGGCFMGSPDPFKVYEDNFRALQDKDAAAKKAGTIVGRFISEPFADGHAYYAIVKEKKTTVDIRVVTGIGDDWRIPYWGDKATVK